MRAHSKGIPNGRAQCPLRVISGLHGHCVDTSAPRAEADVIGGKADVEMEGLLSARERTFVGPHGSVGRSIITVALDEQGGSAADVEVVGILDCGDAP